MSRSGSPSPPISSLMLRISLVYQDPYPWPQNKPFGDLVDDYPSSPKSEKNRSSIQVHTWERFKALLALLNLHSYSRILPLISVLKIVPKTNPFLSKTSTQDDALVSICCRTCGQTSFHFGWQNRLLFLANLRPLVLTFYSHIYLLFWTSSWVWESDQIDILEWGERGTFVVFLWCLIRPTWWLSLS